jgi:anti-sigma B factor antagonist
VAARGDRRPGSDPLRTVVWISGEHDIATRWQLSIALDQATGLDDGDIVVDLSGVTFMDASTIAALVVADSHLRARSRRLSLREPSPRAFRVLDLCGLVGLIDVPTAPLQSLAAPALGSWVDVPAADRGSHVAEPAALQDAPSREVVRASKPLGEAAAASTDLSGSGP